MKKINDKGGFTLIEIIIVLLIIGILAAIALPNLFSNISKTRGEEALATISTYRPTIEACIIKAAGVHDSTVCDTATLGNPGSTANFTYALSGPSTDGDTNYSITATGTGVLTATDLVTVSRGTAVNIWPAIGAVNCMGTGKLFGAC